MAKEFSRTSRISEVLMRELALMIQHEVSDPRVGMVTISHVEISPDLKYAKVYITLLSDSESEQQIQQCLDGLSHAAGFLKRGLAKRVEIRTIPELRFYYDKTLEHGFHMDALIAKANKDLSRD